ncbi:unnamed protein product [Adineta steineri]|uniref:Homeobox domain-containing protein n=1 Tax=Adineta steineri TaxID=433720 RepID=A0A818Y8R9_9BILA|nr:unnamed protein product [Adineta steineri]CAF0958168.1 unnamed protein product [Adineta steineri]CAF0994430.1 unnamed protein product [Adineta steineri]CAF3752716.1 unnamed protein product [Adineta steineri]CAF3841171.1 unnamed protein product [Adineta steineri]
MDAFSFNFDTNSLLTDDTNSDHSSLDWTAFQPTPPAVTDSPYLTTWLSQQDDAVAPEDKLNLMTPQQDEGVYSEIEHFFNGLNQQHEHQLQLQTKQELIEPTHINTHIPIQTRYDISHIEPSHRIHIASNVNEGPPICLPAPLVPRLSSPRSQCYHKLPDHAVKLMQEWYNAHLDDPYPRSPDKKRFITEGNITAQQCRSWFANRRQRLKHVKRNQPRASSSRSHRTIQAKLPQMLPIEEQPKICEQCCHCQQQPMSSLPFPLTPTSVPTPTTLNVVINQQTVEQLIQNSLRKLFNPTIM